MIMAATSLTVSVTVAKVHSTAVAVVPERAVWQQIQRIRCFHDKSYVRWPPHINVLYPFFPDAGPNDKGGRAGVPVGGDGISDPFHGLAIRVGRALSRVAPFRVRLERLRTFRHSARSLTVWAEPTLLVSEPGTVRQLCSSAGTRFLAAGPQRVVHAGNCAGHGADDGESGGGGLLQVQRLLEAEFPECNNLSRDEARCINGFVPHLSLGQLRHEDELQALEAAWQPLDFMVDSVQLISRQGYLSPFVIRYQVPLGLDLDLAFDPDPDLHGRLDAGGRHGRYQRGGRELSGGGRGILRLDVPYLATTACLANAEEDRAALIKRFASPCLTLRSEPYPPGAPVTKCGDAVTPAVEDGRQHHPDGNMHAATKAPHGPATGPLEASKSTSETAAAANTSSLLGLTPSAAVRGVASVAGAVGAPSMVEYDITGTSTGSLPDNGNRASETEESLNGISRRGGSGSGSSSGSGSGSGPSHKEDDGSHGYVWWFAYGAALGAHPQQIGAVQSVAARVKGHGLAFNRRGGRVNLVPTDLAGGPALPSSSRLMHREAVRIQGSADVRHGILEAVPSSIDDAVEANAAGQDEVEVVVADSSATPLGYGSGGGGANGGSSVGARDMRGAADAATATPQVAAEFDATSPTVTATTMAATGAQAPAAAVVFPIPPPVHGVLHKLPMECMTRLLLAVADACPIEVCCVPYDRTIDDGLSCYVSGDAGETVAASNGSISSTAALSEKHGGEIAAVAFYAPPERWQMQGGLAGQTGAPTEEYMALLCRVYEQYGINADFRYWLQWPVPSTLEQRGTGASSTVYGKGMAGGHSRAAGVTVWRTGAKKVTGTVSRFVIDW